MSTTQFIKNPFTSRFCEMMNTPGTHDRQIATYLIGQPNPASIANPGFLAVCEPCAKSIVEKLPDELLPHVQLERVIGALTPAQKLRKIAEIVRNDPALLEILASRTHDSWAGWARWMIDKYDDKMIERWERQIATPYEKLTEKEKESDRREIGRLLGDD